MSQRFFLIHLLTIIKQYLYKRGNKTILDNINIKITSNDIMVSLVSLVLVKPISTAMSGLIKLTW